MYQSLWRYLGFEAVLRTIFFNKLRFTRVARFEDEWELRRGRKSREINEEINKEISEDANVPHMPWPFRAFEDHFRNINFVSSWTKVSPENMTLWMAYTNNHSSVAIESTFGKLSKFETKNLDFANIGPIEYCDVDNKVHYSRNDRELLYLKRDCFEFESEVRLSIQVTNPFDDAGKILNTFEVEIPPGTIQKVIAHPRMDNQTFELLERLVHQADQNIKVIRPKISALPSD